MGDVDQLCEPYMYGRVSSLCVVLVPGHMMGINQNFATASCLVC